MGLNGCDVVAIVSLGVLTATLKLFLPRIITPSITACPPYAKFIFSVLFSAMINSVQSLSRMLYSCLLILYYLKIKSRIFPRLYFVVMCNFPIASYIVFSFFRLDPVCPLCAAPRCRKDGTCCIFLLLTRFE